MNSITEKVKGSGLTTYSGKFVAQPRKIVNPDNKNSLPETDSKGNELTEQQREYFKDSKVVQICQQQACTVSYLYHFIKKRLPELFR